MRVIYRQPGCVCEYIYRDGISPVYEQYAARNGGICMYRSRCFHAKWIYMIELSPYARARAITEG